MSDEWRANIDALEQTARSVIALGEELEAPDWARATECPGWSVLDQYSHILGLERWLLGEAADDEPRTAANTGLDVEALRSWPPEKILGELRGVIDRRLAALRSGAVDLSQVVTTPFGVDMPYGDFLRHRAFDVWMHEQDVRRATGRPGNLGGPAAETAARILGGALPFVVGKRAAAEPGQTVLVETPTRRWCVEVGADRRARFAEETPEPSARLRMEWETFVRLGGGRVDPSQADVRVTGDGDLAGRVLAGMSVTP
ncbi:maleylpyruvate isomerase family mycothiol-dependent enzyme [Actinoallomurus purpureus]|uniref:maleylpyruvate isomerase family mycothiol-dependent enzyme n=1 Tax=Actinoallomurus purpureus TaxID=478114 RepID=UPI002092ACB1|nr:maleylpyruvate isomerase family mycothiol-dependent enzyme [Actinoallomurus purpureus]MCO6004722.1 maleylpyruvate isomerase family mycothiol-dependent enzyme [Actinoallomurus purpureus]